VEQPLYYNYLQEFHVYFFLNLLELFGMATGLVQVVYNPVYLDTIPLLCLQWIFPFSFGSFLSKIFTNGYRLLDDLL